LRVWTIAYAPSNRNNLKRMQEIHRLNAEMWYNVSEAVWRRVFAFIVFWFLVVKVFKHKYLNAQNHYDTHDAIWRDTVAHL